MTYSKLFVFNAYACRCAEVMPITDHVTTVAVCFWFCAVVFSFREMQHLAARRVELYKSGLFVVLRVSDLCDDDVSNTYKEHNQSQTPMSRHLLPRGM